MRGLVTLSKKQAGFLPERAKTALRTACGNPPGRTLGAPRTTTPGQRGPKELAEKDVFPFFLVLPVGFGTKPDNIRILLLSPLLFSSIFGTHEFVVPESTSRHEKATEEVQIASLSAVSQGM